MPRSTVDRVRVLRSARKETAAPNDAGQPPLAAPGLKSNVPDFTPTLASVAGAFVEGVHPHAILQKPLEIDIRQDHLLRVLKTLRFGRGGRCFRKSRRGRPKPGRWLTPRTGRGVDISRDAFAPTAPRTGPRRYAALPTVMLLAERLANTVAPANAAYVVGGIGVQTSSQISACNLNPSRSLAWKPDHCRTESAGPGTPLHSSWHRVPK